MPVPVGEASAHHSGGVFGEIRLVFVFRNEALGNAGKNFDHQVIGRAFFLTEPPVGIPADRIGALFLGWINEKKG